MEEPFVCSVEAVFFLPIRCFMANVRHFLITKGSVAGIRGDSSRPRRHSTTVVTEGVINRLPQSHFQFS